MTLTTTSTTITSAATEQMTMMIIQRTCNRTSKRDLAVTFSKHDRRGKCEYLDVGGGLCGLWRRSLELEELQVERTECLVDVLIVGRLQIDRTDANSDSRHVFPKHSNYILLRDVIIHR